MIYLVRQSFDKIAYCKRKYDGTYEFKIEKYRVKQNGEPIFDLTDDELKEGYINIERQCLIYNEYVCCNIQGVVYVLNMDTNIATKITDNAEQLYFNKEKIIVWHKDGNRLCYFSLRDLKLKYFCNLIDLTKATKKIDIVDCMSTFRGCFLMLLTDYEFFYVSKIHIENNEIEYVFKMKGGYKNSARIFKDKDGIYVYLDKKKHFYEYIDDDHPDFDDQY